MPNRIWSENLLMLYKYIGKLMDKNVNGLESSELKEKHTHAIPKTRD